MEKNNFSDWIQKRTNQIDESWVNNLFKRKQQDQSKPIDIEQEEIYNNPSVIKYSNKVISDLYLDKPLVIVNEFGKPLKPYNGQPNEELKNSIKRYVAAHLIGYTKSYLAISYHDASIIFDFIDSVKIPEQQKTVAEFLNIKNIQSLHHWISGRIPVSKNAMLQTGYTAASEKPNIRKIKSNLSNEKLIQDLIDKSKEVSSLFLGKKGQKSPSFTMDFVDALNSLEKTLNSLDVTVNPKISNKSRIKTSAHRTGNINPV